MRRFCFPSPTFLVDFDDIFDLLAGPGGQDLNQHVVISAGALGTRRNTQTSEYWFRLRQRRIVWHHCFGYLAISCLAKKKIT